MPRFQIKHFENYQIATEKQTQRLQAEGTVSELYRGTLLTLPHLDLCDAGDGLRIGRSDARDPSRCARTCCQETTSQCELHDNLIIATVSIQKQGA
jgi:hypothetical protein